MNGFISEKELAVDVVLTDLL